MDLKGTKVKETYGNLLTGGEVPGSDQIISLYNGDGEFITFLEIQGDVSASNLQSLNGGIYLPNTEPSTSLKVLVLDTSTNKVYYTNNTGGTVTSILAGDGLSGGTITTTGTVSVDTGSSNFASSVKSILNTDNVLSGSNISFDGSTLIVTGSVEISSSLFLQNTTSNSSKVLLVLDTNTNKIYYNDIIANNSNLNSITSGSATASIQTGNFNVNTNTTITGSLTVTGSQITIGNFESTGSINLTNSLEVDGNITGSNLNITTDGVVSDNISIGGAELDTSNDAVVSIGDDINSTPLNETGSVEITGRYSSSINLNTDYGDGTVGTSTIQTSPDKFSIIKQRNGRNSLSLFEYTHGTNVGDDSLKIGVADSTRIYVGGDGNVGIGTTTPSTELTVEGNISGSGNLEIDGNTTIGGNLVVDGNITAEEFYTEYESSSTIYKSGSTKFGDSIDDIHTITGSMSVTGSQTIIGNYNISGSLNISSSLYVSDTTSNSSTRVLVIDTSTNKIYYNDNPFTLTEDAVGVPLIDTSSLTNGRSEFDKFKQLLQEGVEGGSVFQNPIVSTFSLPYTTTNPSYAGGVLDTEGYIHLVPYNATTGSKISPDGVVSTYTLANPSGLYNGGVLAPNGDIHFVPGTTGIVGQKVSPNGVVNTYTIIEDGYLGGVLDLSGSIHFVPHNAKVGQKVSPNGVVSTYSLPYTGYALNGGYWGGVLDLSGSIHFVPNKAKTGSRVDPDGTVNTYPIYVENTSAGFPAYSGGTLDPNGNIHFVPYNATTGSKVEPNGVVSTYTLVPVPTTLKYIGGGVLAPNGDIHFVPYNATVGQKISPNGEASTYSIPDTSFGGYGGILNDRGDIYMISGTSNRIMKIHSQWGYEFDRGVCISPYLNKL